MEPPDRPTLVAGTARPPPQPASGADTGLGRELSSGSVLGDYRIERLLGQGGCGEVYAARRLDGTGLAAVKVMHGTLCTSRKSIERFVREVNLVRLVRHPSIIDIFDLGQLEDGRPYFVMEYVEGEPLSRFLRRHGRLPLAEAIQLLTPVCAALAAAHDAGIVHRDVKPSNVLVAGEGAALTVKLIDFGIAKLTQQVEEGSGLTTIGTQLGTLSAMAPEQILGGHVDARTDVYALGLLLFRMLTGEHPFWSQVEDDVELAWRQVEAPPPRPSARAPVSRAVDAVVLRALEKAPERRFDSVRSFFGALCAAAGGPYQVEAAVHDGLAAAVHVELTCSTPDPSAEEELDAAALADLGRALDLAEDALRARGYQVVLAAGTTLLATRALSGPEAEERRAAEEDAGAIAAAIAARPDADARVRARVRSHVDRALLRLTGAPELLGGPLAELHAWPETTD